MPDGLGYAAIIGAGLLMLVALFAIFRNKQSSDADIRHTEEATHELYEKEHEAAEKRDGKL